LTEVQNDFGLLATVLRLGLRFRYEVIERFQRLARTARLDSRNRQAAEQGMLSLLRRAIEVIENDALSRGAQNIDREAVAALFEREADRDEIAEVQDIWDQTRALLFTDDPPPTAMEVNDVIGRMREINFRFMRIATRRYHEMVCARWSTSPVRPPLELQQIPVLSRE
jgi:hypothetical protein